MFENTWFINNFIHMVIFYSNLMGYKDFHAYSQIQAYKLRNLKLVSQGQTPEIKIESFPQNLPHRNLEDIAKHNCTNV